MQESPVSGPAGIWYLPVRKRSEDAKRRECGGKGRRRSYPVPAEATLLRLLLLLLHLVLIPGPDGSGPQRTLSTRRLCTVKYNLRMVRHAQHSTVRRPASHRTKRKHSTVLAERCKNGGDPGGSSFLHRHWQHAVVQDTTVHTVRSTVWRTGARQVLYSRVSNR